MNICVTEVFHAPDFIYNYHTTAFHLSVGGLAAGRHLIAVKAAGRLPLTIDV